MSIEFFPDIPVPPVQGTIGEVWAYLRSLYTSTNTAWNDAILDINTAISAVSLEWGSIGGTLSDQTDLQTALDGKMGTTTGTGFVHITSGAKDAAAKLVENADVHASAAIVESKLSLNYATHANTNDPSSDQKAALTGTSGTPSSSNKYVTNDDARNTNVRHPDAHADHHVSGGSDSIKLDDLASPDNNTDLDVSTSAHGLCPKAPNDTSKFLRGDGTWSAPSGASALGTFYYRRTGTTRYYNSAINGSALTTGSALCSELSGDTIYAVPIILPKQVSVDYIGVYATTAQTGKYVKLGIYTDDGNVYPNALVSGSDSGALSMTGTGVKGATISCTIGPGLYWLCVLTDSTSGVLRAINVGGTMPILGYTSSLGTAIANMVLQTSTYSSGLPATYPASGSYTSASLAHSVWIRLSA